MLTTNISDSPTCWWQFHEWWKGDQGDSGWPPERRNHDRAGDKRWWRCVKTILAHDGGTLSKMSSLSVCECHQDFPGNNPRHKLQDKLMATLQLIFKANVMIIQTSENLHSENRPLIRRLSSVDLSDIISMIAFSPPRVSSSLWQCHDATLTRVIWQVVTRCCKFWQVMTSCDKMLPPTICLVLSLASRRWMQDPVAHSGFLDRIKLMLNTCTFDHVSC